MMMSARQRVRLGRRAALMVALLTSVVASAPTAAEAAVNGRVAFQSNRGHQPFCCRIVTMNPDGSELRPLLRNFEDSWDPAWSPDGARIAFSSLRGHFDIFTADAAGTDVQRLTRDQKTRDSSPAWSPARDELAFVTTRNENFEVFRMNTDGSGSVNLTQSPANDCGCFEPFFVFAQPAFSPDGSRIAFTSDRDEPGVNLDVYVMDRDGSNVRRLTADPAIDGEPDWSPDGERIAFQSTRDGDADIYLTTLDGTVTAQLTSNDATDIQPDFSPDGTRIAYVSDAGGSNDIWIMTSTGTDATNITHDAAFDERPDWQPIPDARR